MNTDEIKDYGLVVPVIEPDHYVRGTSPLPEDILQHDGDWTPYLPTYEAQAIKFETYGCAFFGTINATETLERKIKNSQPNYSERFPYIIADAQPPEGNDPHKVAETIRKNGLVNQAVLPMTDTLEEFMRPKPMTAELRALGEQYLNVFDFKHEWIFTNNPAKADRIALLREALQYSPVAISVTAWMRQGDLYIDRGQPNTHWVMCFRLEEVDGEICPVIFDSYEPRIKRLHPDHRIFMAKRYALLPSTYQEKLSGFQKIINAIRKLIEQLSLQKH